MEITALIDLPYRYHSYRGCLADRKCVIQTSKCFPIRQFPSVLYAWVSQRVYGVSFQWDTLSIKQHQRRNHVYCLVHAPQLWKDTCSNFGDSDGNTMDLNPRKLS
eukprot:13083_6